MAYFLQQLVNGLTVGCVYGLMAMGYTMVHAIIGQINLAQGAIFMIGAFGTYVAITLLGILGLGATPAALLLALLLAIILTAAHGWASHRVIFRPLVRRGPGYAPLIAAIGLAIFLKEYVRLLQDAGDFWLSPMIIGGFRLFETGPFTLWLGYRQILIVLLTGVVLAAHGLLVTRTTLGRTQRACAQDPGMAALVGIDVARTVGSTYALAAALAAVAGMVVTVHYTKVH